MFCSNCGKTVGAEDRQCPHCHIELGDVQFPGMPYTSVQFRIVPGKPMPIDEAYAYTRKDYSVDIGDDQNGDPLTESIADENVENATAYRPVLQHEEEEYDDVYVEEPDGSDAAAVDVNDEVNPEELSEEQINAALKKMQERGLNTDDLIADTDAEYDEPEASEAEIEERIQRYTRPAQENAPRQKKGFPKIRIPFVGKKAYDGIDDADEAYDEAAYEQSAAEPVYEEADYAEPEYVEEPVDGEAAYDEPVYEEPAQDAYAEEPAFEDAADIPTEGEEMPEGEVEAEPAEAYADAEQYGEYGNDDTIADGENAMSLTEWMNAQVFGIRVGNILKIAGALIVFVICIVLGLKWFGYVSDAQKKSPIDGVTLSLYESGIEAISANATSEKTTEMLTAYSESGVIAFTAMQQQRTDALKALMPEEPGVNDQLFMDTLTHIQENIANAVISDAMSGDANSEESRENWTMISESISSLKSAKDSVALQAIVNETVEVVTTTPTPAATPVSYKVLTRGDEGDEVMKLQQRLFDLGYLADAADGKFGNKTTTAIKYFQMGHELNVTGIADSATQEMLFSDAALDMDAAKAAYQARQAEGNE